MAERIKLAIISTHPIQYNAPLFKLMEQSKVIKPRVFYTWSQSEEEVIDKDFGKTIIWDIPLLEGYDYEFVNNVSRNPGTHHFRGIDNPELIQSVKNWGAQGLLVYGWNFKSHLNVMRHFKGKIPVFFRGDSTLLDENKGVKTFMRRAFLKWFYRHIDYAFYVGTNNKLYFEKHGIPSDHLFFAPHSIDIERFFDKTGENRKKAEQLRASEGIPADKILVTFVGKFVPKKDPLLLLRAAKSPECKHLDFLFVGNGILEDQMKIEAMNRKNIHFMDFKNQSEMPAIYYMSNVICLPSRGPGETWGLVVNEAMSCERAVIASDKCGCSKDLIRDGENGFTFASGNRKDLIVKLMKLEMVDKVKAMGQKSRVIIQSWSYEKTVKGFENGIQSVFGNY